MGVEEPTVEEFRGIKLSDLKLKLDQAFVNITQSSTFGNNEQHYLYLRSENCYKCPFRPYKEYFPEDFPWPEDEEVSTNILRTR